MRMAILPGFYTYTEAAQVLRRSESQVSRYVSGGLLKAIDLGRQKVIEQADVHNFSPPPRGNPTFRQRAEKKPAP